ncbi:MAG: hypothetical protein AMJ67_12160 [Betaproteobacteria bacterium SG8_41]|jgi:molybdate transport system substrate-binding protein|nr:MAG: hypothetical protein AMJ67_12160 [Betaproteobacteria bacterium SG8_41]
MPVHIEVLTSNSMRTVFGELAPRFEHATGHRLAVSYDPAQIMLRRIAGGETADVVILGDAAVSQLILQGKIDRATCRPLTRVRSGLAVRAGAPRPDIGSVEAFKRTLIGSRSIAFSREGASGIHFAKIIERLGIADLIRAKAKIPAGGLVGELVAAGDVEMAVQQIPELLAVPGIELAGPLPEELQQVTVSATGIFSGAEHRDAAQELLDFLFTPNAARVLAAKGLEPV